MVALQDHYDRFEAADATVFGISADSAFAQAAFADEYDPGFDLVSDAGRAAIEADDPTNEPDDDELIAAVEAA